MATGPDLSSAAAAPPPRKDRHIVSWSAEEDDVLRAQIAHHGTDNWTIIAAQFKDKTARQCRRRWYNYLNSECKKGGWSREEDMLLCEVGAYPRTRNIEKNAQKVLGNKWTEIAKVVSGRTDNAVKNRFSTLCKRRVKDEEVFKENGALCSNANAKRILTQTGCLTPDAAGSSPPVKQLRSCKPDYKENIGPNMGLFGREKNTQQDSRQPLASISPINQHHVNIVETQNAVAKTTTGRLFAGEQNCLRSEGNFLNKDDPKFATIVQQADLLCSLATKINTENTSQSMDEAWQKLQNHLVKKDDNDTPESSVSGIASLLEELDDLIVDPYENEEEDQQKSREQDGQIGMDNKQSNGSYQISTEVTSQMPLDKKMDDCPLDLSTEDCDLCRNVLSSSVKPCPEIRASVNMSEAAEDSMLQCMEYTSPAHTVLRVTANAEIPELDNFSEVAEDSGLHCMGCTSPAHTILQAKEDVQMPASEDLSEIPEDARLQCTEFNSPGHTIIQAKAGVEMPRSESFSETAEDSKLPCMEFNSPAHTVPTFQSYTDDMPTPKITASERSFLLSVLELTSPGPRPDSAQQPSCKRALLNSL